MPCRILVAVVGVLTILAAACANEHAPNPTSVPGEKAATSEAPTTTSAAPTKVPESKYDEAWARKQVEPLIKETAELVLAQEWNKLYDTYYSDEDKADCSRTTYVSKMAGIWLLASGFGADEILKAELQDLKDGKLPITFSEITAERITYTVEEGDTPQSTTLVRENGKWVSVSEPLGQDCSSLNME